LTSLGIGEAVVTVLSERGAPTSVAWTRLRAPRSKMGSIGDEAVAAAPEPAPAPQAPAPEAPASEKDEPGFIESDMKNPAVKSFMRSAASALGREITAGCSATGGAEDT
jgi:hypothetical protein